MKRLISVALIAVSGLVFFSCATTKLSQGKFMSLPWPSEVSAESAAQGLSYAETKNPEFPDLYVFVDRTQFPGLFAELWQKLPQFLLNSNQAEMTGLGKIPADWANQLVLFRPAGSQSLQIILVGDYPFSLVQSVFSDAKAWDKRFITNGQTTTPVYESKNQATHVCLVGTNFLLMQCDQVGLGWPVQAAQSFDTFALRSQLALSNQALTKAGDKFQEIILRESQDEKIFGYIGISLSDSSPAAALRLRLEPVRVAAKEYIDVQANLLPRSEVNLRSLRTGIKLALVSLSGLAGLDSGFTNAIIFKEANGNLQFSGLRIDSKGAIRLLDAILNPAPESTKTPKDAPK